MIKSGLPAILLVDDDPAHRMLACRALAGYAVKTEVLQAASLQETLSVLKNYPAPPVLAVIDFNLGKESGVDVLREIRKDPALKQIPAIVVSTSSLESDFHAAYSAGADCFICKDADPSSYKTVLLQAIGFFLKRSS